MRLLPALTVLLLATPALADDPAPAADDPASTATEAPTPEQVAALIEYRKIQMSAIGSHMGSASRIVRGVVARPQDLAQHARAMHDASTSLTELFPAGTGPDTGVEMESLPAIWERWDDFTAAATAFEQATAAFVEATSSPEGDVAGAFRNVGRSCGGCHDDFRLDRDEH